MGYYRETTPILNEMARRGLYFENAITASVPTGPSMFSIFTASYPLINATDYNGKLWRRELSSKITLMDVLTKMGYETIGFSTNPFTSPYFGFNKGFRKYIDLSEKGRAKDIGTNSYMKRLYLNIKKVIKKSDTLMNWEDIYDQIISVVEKAKEPFFMWIILLDTHTPYIPPKKYRRFCKANSLRLLYIYWKLDKNCWRFNDIIPEVYDAYDDSIYYADKFIKRLWDDINSKYDPIFIIHADHGDGLGEHGFYHHPPLLYEELIHVPLVIYNADVKGRIEKPISLLGLAPTILELIGEENEFPSESFLHGGRDWVISKVFEGGKRKVAIRTKEWKFITGQKEEDELYYLKKDPYERENVINEYLELAKEMKRIVEIHVKQEMEKGKIRTILKKLRG